jgi:hypothetical protein
MAIVKAKYVRGKGRIKAHLRYITHRRGFDGERITRPLYGRDGPLSKLQIYETIDAVAGPHLTVGVTDTIAQSRPTSLVSGGRAFWVASIAQAERDTRATHVHSNTGA